MGQKDIEDFIVQPTRIFSQPERLAVATERMKKKNWQSKWPLLEVRFQNKKQIEFEKKESDFSLNQWNHFVIFLYILSIMKIVCWFP